MRNSNECNFAISLIISLGTIISFAVIYSRGFYDEMREYDHVLAMLAVAVSCTLVLVYLTAGLCLCGVFLASEYRYKTRPVANPPPKTNRPSATLGADGIIRINLPMNHTLDGVVRDIQGNPMPHPSHFGIPF